MTTDFDWVELDDVRCGSGHLYTYPPAISDGTSVSATCSDGEDENGPTIDDYDLECRIDALFVSESVGACPVDLSHPLVARES